MKALSDKSIKIQESMAGADSESRPRFNLFRTSLRARVALGVTLPILLVLSSLSLMRFRYERQLLEDQVRQTTLQLGEVMVSSLRRVMLIDDHGLLAQEPGRGKIESPFSPESAGVSKSQRESGRRLSPQL